MKKESGKEKESGKFWPKAKICHAETGERQFLNGKMEKVGLFIFHRDLRFTDNISLQAILKECDIVYPVFIFTSQQIIKRNNPYYSSHAVQFMMESLEELEKGCSFFFGRSTHSVVDKIIQTCPKKITHVAFNQDITPFARKRDSQVREICDSNHIQIISHNDSYLTEPGTILSESNTPYKKFTPFYNTVIKYLASASASADADGKVHASLKGKIRLLETGMKLSEIQHKIGYQEKKEEGEFGRHVRASLREGEGERIRGGRSQGLKRLKHYSLTGKMTKYERNNLGIPTSQMSAHLKFGTVSIREVAHYAQHNSNYMRELIWRDFYAHILYHFPDNLGSAMKPAMNKIRWSENKKYVKAWSEGKTGFPIVDAGMRQLNATGYMHNRARMIVASFFVKTLLQDWQVGEKIFAQKLVDYDPASNNGGWQWIASTGTDSQPYFRIFNPWLQQGTYDPIGEYISKWVPELKDVAVEHLCKWYDPKIREIYPMANKMYGAPIVDYTEQKKKALKMYSEIPNST